jgi:2-dehydro-3-deoxygalactonokinase
LVGRPRRVALVAIDWGTTTARAYWLDEAGSIVAERSEALGVQKIEGGRFREALALLVGGDLQSDAPIVACGMIGSRQGWLEAPYLDCPADFVAMAAALAHVPGVPLAIVPGVICRDADGVPDVMRGEETQVFGALETTARRQLIVLPGTHSKWVLVDHGGIEAFSTFMTGELYAVLREHSILGRLAAPGADSAAFDRGIRASLCDDAALSHDVFSARTLALTGELAPEGVADYLSGLLLGAEVATGRRWIERHSAQDLSVTLIGDSMLCNRYTRALAAADLSAATGPRDAAARGLWRIAVRAGIVR